MEFLKETLFSVVLGFSIVLVIMILLQNLYLRYFPELKYFLTFPKKKNGERDELKYKRGLLIWILLWLVTFPVGAITLSKLLQRLTETF